jgi:hypothetical protein
MKLSACVVVLAVAVGLVTANPLEQRCVNLGGKCQTTSDCCGGTCPFGVRLTTFTS